MACLIWNPYSNTDYETFVLEMEQSYVKLKIAEKEERLRKEKEKKNIMKPVNGTAQKDGKYFLVRLDMEVEKINSLIDSAEKESRLSQLPEEASGIIRNAIGKAQLLLNKRFKQFRELCRDNIENDPDKKETKSSDLQGYWDMMFIQIEDVHDLFKDIDKLRANNWLIDETDGIYKTKDDSKKNGTSATTTPKNKRKSTGKSPRAKSAATTKASTIDDEKVKREARNRLAAVRKQAKLRAQKEAAEAAPSESNSLESSLNGSWTVETAAGGGDGDDETVTTNGLDSSLNSSLNSSTSSSVELINNGLDSVDLAASSEAMRLPVIQQPAPALEVNGVA